MGNKNRRGGYFNPWEVPGQLAPDPAEVHVLKEIPITSELIRKYFGEGDEFDYRKDDAIEEGYMTVDWEITPRGEVYIQEQEKKIKKINPRERLSPERALPLENLGRRLLGPNSKKLLGRDVKAAAYDKHGNRIEHLDSKKDAGTPMEALKQIAENYGYTESIELRPTPDGYKLKLGDGVEITTDSIDLIKQAFRDHLEELNEQE